MRLIDILMKYNFRNYRVDISNDYEYKRNDTYTMRIYLDDNINNDSNYVEFGMYDFSSDESKKKKIKKFINEDMLQREVQCIYQDYELNIFCIMLKEEEKRLLS